ncbi:MAG TPA: D-hexose-6-phosphate mutarotase, partial [Candidatus Angelobacter sp.]|nr:D-hexose-6-phosphate mutarotase [Candidatus Angelobacter sp.]
ATDVLYGSPNTSWQDGRAIRGGVPICFPWFGDNAHNPSARAHGFVRTKAWQLDSIESNDNEVEVAMSTENGDDTRQWWPFDFHLTCRATFGAQFKIELIVANTGTSPFIFEEALHAYFRVGDVQTATIRGLDATRFIDKVDDFTEKPQTGDLRLSAETDRIYLNTTHEIEIADLVLNRRLTIAKENSLTTVVWNPWAEKSATIADLGAGEWQRFVCIETSNVGAFAVRLSPGESHTMTVRVNCG